MHSIFNMHYKKCPKLFVSILFLVCSTFLTQSAAETVTFAFQVSKQQQKRSSFKIKLKGR